MCPFKTVCIAVPASAIFLKTAQIGSLRVWRDIEISTVVDKGCMRYALIVWRDIEISTVVDTAVSTQSFVFGGILKFLLL